MEQEKKRNFYTVREVIDIFDNNVSKTQIHKWIKAGKIKTIAFGSKRLIYASWVDDVLSGRIGEIE